MVSLSPRARFSSTATTAVDIKREETPVPIKREETPVAIKREPTPLPVFPEREHRLIPAVSPAPEGIMYFGGDIFPEINIGEQFERELRDDLAGHLRERRAQINVRSRSRSLLQRQAHQALQELERRQEQQPNVRPSLPRRCKVVKQQQATSNASGVRPRLILNPPRPPIRLRLTQPRPPVRVRLTQPRPPLRIRFPANVVALTIMTRSRTAAIAKAKTQRNAGL